MTDPTTPENIDDRIDAWHNGDGQGQLLHDYLGWTIEQYGTWVQTGKFPVLTSTVRKPILGDPQAYLLHEGMGNYRVELARDFDVQAHSRLDPKPLFMCPSWPHEKGLIYDPAADEGVCRLCGYHTPIEMGSM